MLPYPFSRCIWRYLSCNWFEYFCTGQPGNRNLNSARQCFFFFESFCPKAQLMLTCSRQVWHNQPPTFFDFYIATYLIMGTSRCICILSIAIAFILFISASVAAFLVRRYAVLWWIEETGDVLQGGDQARMLRHRSLWTRAACREHIA